MNAPVALPTKADRIEAYRSASWPHRLAMHAAIAAHKGAALAARRDLGRRYLAEHQVGIVVPYDRAALAINLEHETHDARAEAIALAKDRASQHESASLQYP